MADWSLLPANLVNDVAALLRAPDQARMASACKSWRQAMADGARRTPPKPSLWVFLADRINGGNLSDRCEFRSFSEDLERKYFFSAPFADVRVLPSWRGWIMLEDESTRLRAFNPVTKATHSFPAAGCPGRYRFGVIYKAVIVTRKGLPVMAAIIREGGSYLRSVLEVALAEAGDDTWTTLAAPRSSIDIMAHEGKLYVITGGTLILVYDLRERKPAPLSPAAEIGVQPNRDFHFQNFLGIISGALVLVRWRCPNCARQRLIPDRPQIEVLKLDPTGEDSWVAMKSLDGHAILVDHDGVLALPAAEFDELTADCFYSLHSQDLNSNRALTVWNFGTKDVSFQSLSIAEFYLPVWFLPDSDDI